MLSREERIFSELLLARGLVERGLIDGYAMARQKSAAGPGLAEMLVDSGEVERERVLQVLEEARAIDQSLAPELAAGTRIGEFRLVREIGRGGMGIVYEAEQESLGRRVALKILPSGGALDERLAVRFVREARAAARLRHPGIVPVYSSGLAAGVLYFAMELVDGRPLSAVVSDGPLPPSEAARIIAQVARALAHAHQEHLVHRDVKPENILLTAEGSALLTDFGLVYDALGDPFTLSHHVLGTPAYIPPEQARGEPVDARADIYSLGGVLYALLAGRPPYSAGIPSAILARVLSGPPPPLASVRGDVPSSLVAICERAMARRTEDRYHGAADLGEDLERFLRGEPSGEGLEAGPAFDGRAERWLGSAGSNSTPGQIEVATGPAERLARSSAAHRWFALPAAALIGLAAIVVFALAITSRYWRPDERGAPAARRSIEGVGGTGAEGVAGPRALEFTLINETPSPKCCPSLSPDGMTLAYAARRDPRWDVYLQDLRKPSGLGTSCLSESMRGGAVAPSFSPNGRTIALLDKDRNRPNTSDLSLLDLADKSLRRLVSAHDLPAWSHDGSEILFTDVIAAEIGNIPGGRTGSIQAINLLTGSVRTVRTMNALHPSWSPHGARIAFASLNGGQVDIWTINRNGGEAVRVTDEPAVDWNPVWSSDGRFLIFGSDRTGLPQLWRVGIDEASGRVRGSPERFPNAVFAAPFAFAKSRDGKRVAIIGTSERGRLCRLEIDPLSGALVRPPSLLPQHPAAVSHPELSPDGKVMAFSTVGSREDLAVMPLDDPTEPVFLSDDAFRDRAPRWAPAGDRIAFTSDRTGSMEIWTIRPDGGDLRQVTHSGGRSAAFPVWSPDARRFAYTVEGEGAYLASATEDGGAPEALPRPDEAGARFEPWSWSVDGELLAGSLTGSVKGIAVYSIRDRRHRRLTESGEKPVWLPTGRRLVFVDDRSIKLLDARTGESRLIFSAAPSGVLPSVAISPDGKTIYASLTAADDQVWVADLE